jgi:hypothetical protein
LHFIEAARGRLVNYPTEQCLSGAKKNQSALLREGSRSPVCNKRSALHRRSAEFRLTNRMDATIGTCATAQSAALIAPGLMDYLPSKKTNG